MASIRTRNIIKGGSFNSAADLALWTQVAQTWEIFTSNFNGTDPFDGVGSVKPTDASTGTAELAQVSLLSEFDIEDDTVDDGLVDINFSGYHAGDSSGSDNQRFIVEALDDVDSVLATLLDSGTVDTSDNNWQQFSGTASLPVGTRKVKVRLLGTLLSASSGFNAYFDSIACYAVIRDRFSRQVELSRDMVYRNSFDTEQATEPELAVGVEEGTFNGTADRTGLGRFGQAYESNASGDSLTTPNYRDVQTDPTSVAAWIYLDVLPSSMFGAAPRKIVAKGSGTDSGWFLGVLSGDTLTFQVVDAALSVYSAQYTFVAGDVGKWIHVVGTQSGSAIKLYVDGVIQDNQLVAGALLHDDATPVEVGLNWEGRVDQVQVWNKELLTSNSDGINEITEASKPYGGPDSVALSFIVPEFNTVDPVGVTGQGAVVPHTTDLNPATGGYTVEALVELPVSTGSDQRILSKVSDSGFSAWDLSFLNSGVFRFTARVSTTEVVQLTADPELAVGKDDIPDGWLRVTGVRTDDNFVRLYFNGDLVAEGTTTTNDNHQNTEDVGLGQRADVGFIGDEPYNGGIVDVRFWSEDRSRQLIRATRGYNEADRDNPSLVSLWLCDEGTGTTAHDSVSSHDAVGGSLTWGVKAEEDNALQYDDTMTLSWWWNNFTPDVTDKYLVSGQSGSTSRNPGLPLDPWDVQSFAAADILCLSHDPVNDIWVAGASDGHIWTSHDFGLTWVDQGDVASSNAIRGAHWSNGVFIICGDGGLVLTSPDADNWSTRAVGLGTVSLYDVTRVEDTWIVVGAGGAVATATSLNSWSTSAYPHAGAIRGVSWNLVRDVGNQSIIAVGDAGEVAVSSDKGATWSAVTSGLPATQLNAVHHFQGTWVLVGNSGLLAYRENFDGDGAWTTVASGAPGNLNDVHHALFDGRWVLGGDDNFVLSSGDGKNWTTESTGLGGTDDVFAVHSKDGTGFTSVNSLGNLTLDAGDQYDLSFDEDVGGLDYTDSPFQIIVLPVNPNPTVTDADLDCDVDNLDATVSLGISDGAYSTYYWEVEMVPDQAYLRINETGPISLPSDPSTIELSFTQPESIDVQGKRIRFVIVPQQLCGSVLWTSPWITLNLCDGSAPPGPGPDEDVFAPVIFNIYLNTGFDEFRKYSLEREPDIDSSTAEDAFWHCVQIDPDDECGPAPVDARERKLVLKNLPAGRYRYRFTAQFTDKTVYQDFILFVRPDSDEDNY